MATDAARTDTFPKLLIRNARLYAGRPAYRHKDLGIWQVWTWEQVLEEVRAYAAGLARLGLKRGDTMAIVGSNRPKLYWSVTAAQMVGAVPVPVYADAGPDEVAFVLAHSDARFAAVEDQEQVDKLLSIAERLPKLERIVYDERRGLRDYDHGRLRAIADVIVDGRGALAEEPALGQGSIAKSRRARARTVRSFSIRRAPRASRRASYCPPSAVSMPPPTRSLSTSSPQATRRSLTCRSLGSGTIISTMRKRWSQVSALPVRRAPTLPCRT